MLEFVPRDSSVAWASSILDANQDKEVILVTHEYMYSDNTRVDRCVDNSGKSFGVSNDNDGQPLWERFVSKYGNINVVLSGHIPDLGGAGRRDDFGNNGNLVHQMLSDYQAYANGSCGPGERNFGPQHHGDAHLPGLRQRVYGVCR